MSNTESTNRSVAIAIVAVAIAFTWLGYAYLKGPDYKGSDGQSILLLHTIIPIALIILLFKLRHIPQVNIPVYVAMALIVIWIFVKLLNILMPFILGFALAYMFRFVLDALMEIPLPGGKRIQLQRRWARLILVIITILALGGLAIYIPQVIDQSQQMGKGIAEFYNETLVPQTQLLVKKLQALDERMGTDVIEKATLYVQQKWAEITATATSLLGKILSFLGSTMGTVAGAAATGFLALIVFIYAVKSFDSYMMGFCNLFPEDKRAAVIRYASEIDNNMKSFLRGQFTVIVIISAISTLAYGIIGVPFFLFIGIIAGICNAIPTVGPAIGGIFAFIALLAGYASDQYAAKWLLVRGLALLGVIFGIQAMDNSMISPRIMSKAVDVDPLLIMLGIFVGTVIFGFWGVLLAIPSIVIIKSCIEVSHELRQEEQMEKYAEEVVEHE
ncbi:TPA: AI-2E family transporter [Candidatus Poribacteria bacterium]|nr:AI-2E family transporter [Candidatus Poribacteria bacterium]